MNIDWLRQLCLSFPGVTEQIQWGCDLVFKAGGKMFAVAPLEPAPVCLSFKTSPENFAELTERAGIIPAPYLARAQWVALETRDALPREQLAALLRESYDLITAKLPKQTRESLLKSAPAKRKFEQKRASRKQVFRKKSAGKKRSRKGKSR